MIVFNLDKARSIAHSTRRTLRAKEFAPLDIMSTVPSEAVAAEAARQAIRKKYAAIQDSIDAASGIEDLKSIFEGMTK